MTVGTLSTSTEVRPLFILYWVASIAVPAAPFVLSGIIWLQVIYSNDLLSVLVISAPSLAAGWFQSRLLMRHLPRYRLWVVFTTVGASIGIIGAVVTLFLMNRYVVCALGCAGISSESAVDRALLGRQVLAGLAGAVSGGILGSLQLIALDGLRSGRLLWFGASALSGLVAAWAVVISGDAMSWLISEFIPGSFDWNDVLKFAKDCRRFSMLMVGLSVFGLLTGIVMRRLLKHRAQQHNEELIGEFD